MMNNNSWTPSTYAFAQQRAKQAKVYKWLHLQVAIYYQKVDRLLGIPAFFFCSAIGTSLIGSATIDDNMVSIIITWICVSISFITAGLLGILYYLDPSTLAQLHSQKSIYFDDIYHDLLVELSTEPELRQDSRWILGMVQKKFAMAQQLPPIIPQSFWKQHETKVMNGFLWNDLKEMDNFFKESSSMGHISCIVENYQNKEEKDTEMEKVIVVGEEAANEKAANEEAAEEEEFIDSKKFRNQLRHEMCRVRKESKLRREQYQLQRFAEHDGLMKSGTKAPNDLEKQ